MKTRRFSRILSVGAQLLVAVSLCGLPGASAAGAATPTPVASLGVGDSAFWDGGDDVNFVSPLWMGYIATFAPAPELCGVYYACFDYAIQTVEAGDRLRVAFDQSSTADSYAVELYDPLGLLVQRESVGGLYSTELFVPNPAAGVWVVRVMAYNVRHGHFRMRAKLERLQPAPNHTILPNLRATPPFEVAFLACKSSEISEYGLDPATARCLRFSQGPQNVGEGPLDLVSRLEDLLAAMAAAAQEGDTDAFHGPQYQRIHCSGGTPPLYDDCVAETRPAGTFEYHTTHQHFHHHATGNYELYKVTDRGQGRMAKAADGHGRFKVEPAADGYKVGFCFGDYNIADWSAFNQDPHRALAESYAFTNCGLVPGPEMRMVLSAGWGDVYYYGLPGNFVNFGTNTDGHYVIRITSDPENDILESDETDNVSYTFIRVTGNQVEVLERGFGSDPWDRNKVLDNSILRGTCDGCR